MIIKYKKQLDDYKYNGYTLFKEAFNPIVLENIKTDAQNIFRLMFKKNNITEEASDEKSFNSAIYKLFQINYGDFIGAARASQHTVSMNNFAVSEGV